MVGKASSRKAPGGKGRGAGPRRRRVALVAAAAVLVALAAGMAAAFAFAPPQGLEDGAQASGADAVVGEALEQTAKGAAGAVGSVADAAEAESAEGAAGLERALVAQELAAERPVLDLGGLDYGAIPASDAPATFSLAGAAAPVLPDEASAAINAALGQACSLGTVGFVLLDCASGTGVAASAGAAVYGASTYKGPYATYVCEQLVDGGVISLDSSCPVTPGLNYEGTFGLDASSYPVRTLVEALIANSDNDAFRVLRGAYDSRGYNSWMGQFGDDALAARNGFYPTYGARTSLKLWAHIYQYLESGSATASWLSGLFANTHVSFLRDGVARTGLDATVRNKAGWYAGDAALNCTSDAGIVQIGGSTYLVSIMTSMPYSDASVEAYEQLAAALFDSDVLLALR